MDGRLACHNPPDDRAPGRDCLRLSGGQLKLTSMAKVHRAPGATVLELGPSYASLDQQALQDLGGILLSEAIYADPPQLILDLSQTSYIGSSFIELLVRAWRRIQQRQGRLVLCATQPFCSEVLRAAHLDTIWITYPTREEALAALSRAGAD